MKVVILAGGWGTRLGHRIDLIPKPMVKIGNIPILWHIMKIYSHYNFNDNIICIGVKGDIIKEYFFYYEIKNNDFKIDTLILKKSNSSESAIFSFLITN